MKTRPSIALCMIVKNEAHNLSALLESVQGCFDYIYVTDTGSTDNTVDVLESLDAQDIAEAPIHLSHFKWVNDFSKARQFNFDQVPGDIDYVMWMDGDDVLFNRKAFLHWRDNSLHCAHQWLNPYEYAFDHNGNPVCTFLRERVVKNEYGFKWRYFVHEGLVQSEGRKVDTQLIESWCIKHMRTDQDTKQDRSRNLKLFQSREDELEPRLRYYYGKELFEAGEYLKALKVLQDVCETPETVSEFQFHDRVMAYQYLSMSYAQCGKWKQSQAIALNAMVLCPERAEFWNLVGDSLIRQNQISQAILYYKGSMNCPKVNLNGLIYTSPQASFEYPAYQLAQVYLNHGNSEEADKYVSLLESAKHPAGSALRGKVLEIKEKNVIPDVNELVQTDDIVISTPPGVVTSDWDEKKLEKEGMGGSETACVEIARLLKKKTGKPVKVFQQRKSSDVMPSGVEYLPLDQLESYIKRYKPLRHIAWRHAVKLTPSPTYVWSHDLLTPGGQAQDQYEKYWCLSGFHKEFVQDMQKVSPDKIDLVFNGVDLSLFDQEVEKNPWKVFFSSSPDRGLERCIEICKRAREDVVMGDLELHIFYGTGNMRKMGMVEEADRLDKLVRDHDFVKFHGFVPKKELVRHMLESAVWLYPADFIETSCITAMEAVSARAWPLVRNMGALKYTLSDALDKDQCTMLDVDACDDESYWYWAKALVDCLKEQKWKRIDVDPKIYAWENRIDDYIKSMNL